MDLSVQTLQLVMFKVVSSLHDIHNILLKSVQVDGANKIVKIPCKIVNKKKKILNSLAEHGDTHHLSVAFASKYVLLTHLVHVLELLHK